MTTTNKLFITGALILGLQLTTYGYNPAVCNAQIVQIEKTRTQLKSYCDEKAIEAALYLKKAVNNEYRTSDATIIELAEVLNSSKSIDEIINCIIAIKTKEEIQNTKEEIQNLNEAEQSRRRSLFASTVVGTLYFTVLAYTLYMGTYARISDAITEHDNNLITQIINQLNNKENFNNNSDNKYRFFNW